MKMNKFAEEVHQNAVEHGWWDEERSFGEIIALCHSELSEALEEYRAKRPMVYFAVEMDDGKGGTYLAIREDIISEEDFAGEKPEGIAVELADCIIRILDWYGNEGLDTDALLLEAGIITMCDLPTPVYGSFGDFIALLHNLLSMAYACWCNASGTSASALRLAKCIREIMAWAKENSVDMEMVLDIKHGYNKGRPYRHGGKVL
ncbi:hypothetical protein [Flintibacter porci]|uniref:hypothetical protein n=1 Tax=Flintibacter porci TaxID=3342383 RepID=UPI003F88C71C